jgi:hypothetical protein
MLDVDDALIFIDAAREELRPVLGVESFRVTETTRRPMMDHILDMSVGDLPADSWAEARLFLEQRRHLGFMFEIVV